MSIVGILSRCKCESGSRQNAKAPFESEDGNALEEPKLECAPGHSIDPSVTGSAHGAHPGDSAISRRRSGNQVRPPRTSAFVGKLHEFLQCTSKASNLRGQVAALPVR